MATNKHALIRYKVLDRCLRNFNKRFYIEDLIEACDDALRDYAGEKSGVKKRQIFKDLLAMEEDILYGVKIDRIRDGQRVYYRYKDRYQGIENLPFKDDDINKLKETLFMLRRMKGLPSYEWVDDFLFHMEGTINMKTTNEDVIEFQNNPYLKGAEYIEPLMMAAINHQPLKIWYQKYNKQKAWFYQIHPYFLKQYNNRWFLFGLDDKFKRITQLALDRIANIEESSVHFIPNTEIDFREEYFADIIGVSRPSKPEECIVQDVILQFDEKRFPYVDTKPIHESQTILSREERKIRIQVIPNKELESLLLSFGNQVEVLEPVSLRESMAAKIAEMLKIYAPMHEECTNN